MSSEDWEGWKEWEKEQKEDRRQKNMEVLETCPYEFTTKNHGESLLFREEGKPPIDFYPGTGRWRIVGVGAKTFRGGATAFLSWYSKQKALPSQGSGGIPSQKASHKLTNELGQEVKPYNHPTIPPWDDDAPENELV